MNRTFLSLFAIFALFVNKHGAATTVANSPISHYMPSKTSFSNIIIKGNRRIENITINNYLIFSDRSKRNLDINNSIKSLYETGMFSNINITKSGPNFVIYVSENPIINKIAFEGNDKVGDDVFEKFFGDRIKSRNIFRINEIKALTNEILKIYRAQGRFLAKVTPQIIKLKENRINVVFKIDEGPMALIKQISFIGNNSFSDYKLQTQLMSCEHQWWKFWTSDDIYAPEKVELDKKELINFYKRNGYIDVQVISAIAELSQDRKDFYLTYKIKEGRPYFVSAISIDSDFKNINKKLLSKKIVQKIDQLYCLDDVEESENAILDSLSEEGFVFADVQSNVIKLDENHVKLIFKISRGPKIYIGRINIVGNAITMDTVIRREMSVEEKDPFNSVKLRESNNKIRDLDFFSQVNIEQQSGERPEIIDLVVNVTEKPTARINFQLGVQIGSGLFGELGITETNFLGTGKSMSASVGMGQRTRAFSMQMVNPYFLGRKLSFMMEGGFSQQKRAKTTAFKQDSFFGGFSFGYDITKHLSHIVGYRLSFDRAKDYRTRKNIDRLKSIKALKPKLLEALDLPDPDTMSEEEIKEFNGLTNDDYGSHTRSKIYSVLNYSDLDSYIRPRSGYIISLSNSLCGVGGNVKYTSNVITGKYFMPVAKTLTAMAKVEAGFMTNKPLLNDRFSLGGDDLKGFDYDGVGPREKIGDQYALRGMRYYVGTLALKIPIIEGDMSLDCILFTQMGALWKSKKSKKFVFEDKKLRANIGCGIEWRSPMGPLAITYAYAYKKKKYDETQRFQIGYFVTL